MLKLQINLWQATPNAEIYIATPKEIDKKGNRFVTLMFLLTIPYFILVIFLGIKIDHTVLASIVGGVVYFSVLIIFGLYIQPKKYREVLARIEYPDDNTFIFTSKKYPENKTYNAREYNTLKSTLVGGGIQLALCSKTEEVSLANSTLIDDVFDRDAIVMGDRHKREQTYVADEALAVLFNLILVRDGSAVNLVEAKKDVYNL